MATYWPDLILPTTLADSGGSAEDRTMALSALTGGGAARVPTLVGCVAVSGSGFATDRVGGIAPASEKMGTEEIAVESGMTPRAVGEEGAGDNSAL